MEDKQSTEITNGVNSGITPTIGEPNGTPNLTVPSDQPVASGAKASGFHLPGGVKLWIGLGILFLLLVLGIAAFVAAKRASDAQSNASLSNTNKRYESQKIDLSGVYPSDTINLSTSQSLSINGQLRTNNSLVLTPTDRPDNVAVGQIYYDKSTNSPYIYNGQSFVGISTGDAVRSVGGATGEIVLGAGLLLQNGQLSLSQDVVSAVTGARAVGVTSLQGQTGAVSLTAGSGIAISGTTITNTGVRSVQAASPQLTVTAAGNGVFNIGTVGDLVTGTGSAGQIAVFTGLGTIADSILSQSGGSIVVNGDLQATGQLQASTISNVAAGQDLTLSAGVDQVVFVSEGRTFQLPSVGAVNQTICTVGMDCSTGGGGSYLILQPGTVQEDSGSGPSIFVNNTGGGDLLRVQGNGLNSMVITNNGSSSFAGNMTVAGTINGATISGGNISGGTVNGAFISGGTMTGGTLTDTSVNGLNVSGTAISSSGALTISGGNNQNINLNAFGTGVVSIGSAELQGTGALLVSAGGIDQNLTLSGSGTGNVTIMVPRFIGPNGATYTFNAADAGAVNATICTSVGNCLGAGGGLGGGGTAGTIAVFNGTGFTVGDSLLSQSAGTVTITGDLAANNLQGNGGGITDINAGNITVGVLSDGRLSNNVALYSAAIANFSGSLQQGGNDVCTTAGNCAGSSAGIGGSGTNGTIAVFNGSGYTLTDSLLSQSAGVVTVAGDLVASNLQGNGSAVTDVNAALLGGFASSYYLDATNISTGTLDDGRLSLNVTMQGNAFNGANQLVQLNATGQLPAISGALLTNLNANSVTAGTLSDARLSANVALFDSATANFTGALQQGGNDVCTTAGNCVGSGSGAIGGGGTAGTLAVFDGTGYTVADSLLSQSAGVVTVAGDLVATNLQGNGSAITDVNAAQLNGQAASYYLNASNISTGTLADARLSVNVTLQGNTFNGAGQLVQLNGTAQLPAISGALLTDLNASNIGTGTLADARLSANVTLQGNTFNGISQLVQLNASGQLPVLSGALLTDLNASSLTTGTVADGRLSANVALYAAATANFTGALQQGGNDVCTTAGNCVGAGGGAIGGGGTAGTLAVFDGTGFTVADSIVSQAGGVLSVSGASTISASGVNQDLTLQGTGTGGVVIKTPSFNNANGATYSFSASDGALVNATICTSQGNCVGSSGGAIGGGGTAGTLAVFDGTGFTIADSIISQAAGVVTVAGDLVASNLQGNGSAVTDVNAAQLNGQAASYYLNASNINAGMLADARLSTNVTLQGNTFNGVSQLVQLNASGQLPAISGALLTNLNASAIASGTLADGRLSTNVALYNAQTANFTGNLQEAGFDVCTTAGNCVGSGSGGALGGSGTAGTIAVFNGTGYTLGDSMITQNGTGTILNVSGQLTATNGIAVTGNSTIIGTLSSLTGLTSTGTITGDNFNAASGGYSTGGTVRLGNTGDLQNITGFTQISGNFTHSGTGNFSTGTGSIFLNGSTAVNSTLNVSGATTFENYLTINGGQFTNNGSTLNSATNLTDFAANGSIGTAANTVNRWTTFAIPQTTPGITLTMPDPTTTMAGRIVYIMNTGSASFTMYGATVAAGAGQMYMWNGTAWTLGASGTDGVSGSGAANTIAMFTGGGTAIANSMLSQDGSGLTLTVSGNALVSGDLGVVGDTTFNGQLTVGGLNSVGVVHTDASGVLSTSFVTNADLQGGTYSAITGTGILSAGSIASGFGSISTGNNITTTATVQGATINATTGIQTNGTTRLNSTGGLTNITNYAQTSGIFSMTGTIAAFNASSEIQLTAPTTILTGDMTVSGTSTLQNTSVAGQFTNEGATLNTAWLSAGFGSGSQTIGTAASTVDIKTSFVIAQSTAGSILSLPNPTDSRAGRTVYVLNTGTAAFTMHGVSVNPGYGQIYVWNGTAWVLGATGGGSSMSLQGAYDGGNTINTTDSRNISFTLANTTTDANFITNIASGSTGQFKIQNNGTDVMSIGSAGQLSLSAQGAGAGIIIGGDTTTYRSGANRLQMSNALTLRNTTDTATAFQVQTAAGVDVLAVNTASNKLVVTNADVTGNLTVTGNLQGTQGAFSGSLTVQTAVNSATAFRVQDASGTSMLSVDTVAKTVTVSNAIVGATGSLTVTGGATGTRPATPTEGMVYYDTTTKQLITYANGKWQAGRSSDTKIVAANNSSQAAKDAADFVVSSADETAGNADAAISAAIATLPAGGGTIFLMEGIYTVDTGILLPSNTILAGAGSNSTIIRLKNAHNANINVLDSNNSSKSNIRIQDIRVDGNKAGQTAGTQNGIYVSRVGGGTGASATAGMTIRDTDVINFRNAGIDIYSSENGRYENIRSLGNTGSGIYVHWNVYYSVFTGVESSGNGVHGLWIDGARYNKINSSKFNNNGSSGVRTEGTNTSEISFSGNTIQSNTGFGIDVRYGLAGSYTNNYISLNASGGIRLEMGISQSYTGAVIANNTISNNTGDGIRADRDVSNATISGNRIVGNTAYGINLFGYLSAENPSENSISGNYVYSNASGGIRLEQADNNTIQSNTLANNGGTTTNNAIMVNGSNSVNNDVSNNVITDNSCTTTCYALSITGPQNTFVSGNTIGNGTILDSSASTRYGNQIDVDGNLMNRSAAGTSINTTSVSSSFTLQGGMTTSQLPTPAQPTVGRVGASGASTYGYRVSAFDGTGETLASTERTITNGNALLDATNYNTITWVQVPGAVQYRIYRTTTNGTPATTGLIGTVSGGTTVTFNDTGLAASTVIPTANTTGGATFASTLKTNTASGFTGNLLDLQVNGASRFSVTEAGNTTIGGTLTVTNAATFNGTVTVAGAVTLSSTLTVSGATTVATITVNGHIIGGGNAPTIAAGTAACTTPTVSVSGTDTAGTITITTGTACSAGGQLARISFNGAFSAAPRVTLTPTTATAAGLSSFVNDATINTGYFDVEAVNPATDSTTYKWNYHVIQ